MLKTRIPFGIETTTDMKVALSANGLGILLLSLVPGSFLALCTAVIG